METEHIIKRQDSDPTILDFLVTHKVYTSYVRDYYNNCEDVKRYRREYTAARMIACRAMRAINCERLMYGGTLTTMDVNRVILGVSKAHDMSGLQRKYYLLLTSSNQGQPTRTLARYSNVKEPFNVTGLKAFLYGRFFERQMSYEKRVNTADAMRIVEEASRLGPLKVVSHNFGQGDTVEYDVERFVDGALPYVYTRLIIEKSVYEELKKDCHWADFVNALQASTLVVG